MCGCFCVLSSSHRLLPNSVLHVFLPDYIYTYDLPYQAYTLSKYQCLATCKEVLVIRASLLSKLNEPRKRSGYAHSEEVATLRACSLDGRDSYIFVQCSQNDHVDIDYHKIKRDHRYKKYKIRRITLCKVHNYQTRLHLDTHHRTSTSRNENRSI